MPQEVHTNQKMNGALDAPFLAALLAVALTLLGWWSTNRMRRALHRRRWRR